MLRWAYHDADGRLHAVTWDNGQVLGDEQAVMLIRLAVEQQQNVDPTGIRASLADEGIAYMTITAVLSRWFEGVHDPDIDLAPLPPGAVR